MHATVIKIEAMKVTPPEVPLLERPKQTKECSPGSIGVLTGGTGSRSLQCLFVFGDPMYYRCQEAFIAVLRQILRHIKPRVVSRPKKVLGTRGGAMELDGPHSLRPATSSTRSRSEGNPSPSSESRHESPKV